MTAFLFRCDVPNWFFILLGIFDTVLLFCTERIVKYTVNALDDAIAARALVKAMRKDSE